MLTFHRRCELRSTMMQYPLTLGPMLERAGRLFGAVEIVSRRADKSIHRSNYAELHGRSLALAAALAEAGLHPGDRVASLLWNHVWHLEAYFGVPFAGGVLHMLNPRLHPDELAYIINHAEDRILIVDEVLLPVFEKVREKVNVERVLVVSASGQGVPAGWDDYEEFLRRAPTGYLPPPPDEDAPAAMCYTSGTTGVPKGVVYSHRALVLHAFCAALPDHFCFAQGDSVLPVVPMFHANAWGMPHVAVLVGVKLVLPGPNLDPCSLLDLLDQERVTRAAGVPTVWLGIREVLELNPGRWTLREGLKVFIGGAAVPESLIRAFDRCGVEILQAWGMTEMSPVGTIACLKGHMLDWTEDQRVAVRARQGMPVPFVEVRVISPHGEAPWDGETLGELEVRGPWIAASYYNLAEQQQERWTSDGWFRTGDVVTIDPEGYIKIADRTKDLIKSGGEWISSIDLENMLMGHPAVREAAVIAVADAKWGERPLAAVVLKQGCHASEEELQSHLATKFSRWQLPDSFKFLDEIPRTSVAKFKKSRLREMLRATSES